MKRFVPWLIAAAGVIVVLLVLPLYRPGQPIGTRITRPEAQKIADRAAREVGIDLDKSWSTLIWVSPGIFDEELRRHPQRAQAWNDPVLGARTRSYARACFPARRRCSSSPRVPPCNAHAPIGCTAIACRRVSR